MTETCKAGKHPKSRVRTYKYKRPYFAKKANLNITYRHDIEVCLDCLRDKRNEKKGSV